MPLTSLLRDTPALRGLDAMGYDRATVASALSQVGARFFERYAASRGKARWADKTPDYVDIVENLWELFGPGTRFVLVYRHGMDVAYSLADPRRQYPAIRRHVERAGGDVPVGAANFWVEQTRTMERFRAAHPDACFTLRYEDVTDRPEPALRELFAFLGEPWEPAVLEYQRFEHHRGMEDPDVHRRPGIVRNSGRYRAWPPERQDAVHAVCEPMLAPLGYA